jgi:hypothetical protein
MCTEDGEEQDIDDGVSTSCKPDGGHVVAGMAGE